MQRPSKCWALVTIAVTGAGLITLGAAAQPVEPRPTAPALAPAPGEAAATTADEALRLTSESIARGEYEAAMAIVMQADPQGTDARLAALLRTARIEQLLRLGAQSDAHGLVSEAQALYLQAQNEAPQDDRVLRALARVRAGADRPVTSQPTPEPVELGRLEDRLRDVETRMVASLEGLERRLTSAERELDDPIRAESAIDRLEREVGELRRSVEEALRAARDADREVRRLDSRVSRLESK